MKILLLIILIVFMIGCSSNSGNWTVLFDGEKTYGLRGYKQPDFPWDSWAIENGTLKTIPPRGVDMITDEVYKNFELELEWKVSPAGNSGIFYFATEEADWIWQSALEMQVLDDDSLQDGKLDMHSAGALYDLIPPSAKVVKPVGEFNQARIIVKDNHVEHWLNGTKILEYEYGSETLQKLIADSKFNSMPHFAKAVEGHIGLQHHGEEVWFRNIRIRKL